MTINSRIDRLVRSNFYSDSEENDKWIQPSIISLDLSQENNQLIDDLYVKVTNASKISDIDQAITSEILLWETASNYDLFEFESRLESENG